MKMLELSTRIGSKRSKQAAKRQLDGHKKIHDLCIEESVHWQASSNNGLRHSYGLVVTGIVYGEKGNTESGNSQNKQEKVKKMRTTLTLLIRQQHL